MKFFKKYSSIENSYDQKLVEKTNIEFPGEEFVCEEKIHGSNMSFVVDREFNVSAAKRTDLIKEGETFYNYERPFEKNKENIIALARDIMTNDKDILFISVFGELCGGHYPNFDKIKNVSLVQKGIYYNPDQCFIGFDICVFYENETAKYVDVDDKYKLFEKHNITYSKELFRGSLNECLEYNNEYISTIPSYFGLPEVENNICEGNVIKSVKSLNFRNGSRVILKNKNSRFSEIKNSPKPKDAIKQELPENIQNCLNEMIKFVNENRLNNVISKIGEVSMPKELGRVNGLFTKDALEDYLKIHGEDFNKLEKDDRKRLQKLLSNECMQFVKSLYLR